MFALAMLHLAGRTGAVNREQGAKLLGAAAELGNTMAAYNLALLYLEGQSFPQEFTRAAELFRTAAQAGNPEAQYALATLYKEGRGVPKDLGEAARLLAAASSADNTDAQVEYAIALFNGTGVARNEQAAAALLEKAARKGNPIAQNRLANVLAVGRGLAADPVQAIKWHIVAKAGGISDIPLDAFVEKQPPDVRAAGEKAAKPFVDALKEPIEEHVLRVVPRLHALFDAEPKQVPDPPIAVDSNEQILETSKPHPAAAKSPQALSRIDELAIAPLTKPPTENASTPHRSVSSSLAQQEAEHSAVEIKSNHPTRHSVK